MMKPLSFLSSLLGGRDKIKLDFFRLLEVFFWFRTLILWTLIQKFEDRGDHWTDCNIFVIFQYCQYF